MSKAKSILVTTFLCDFYNFYFKLFCCSCVLPHHLILDISAYNVMCSDISLKLQNKQKYWNRRL